MNSMNTAGVDESRLEGAVLSVVGVGGGDGGWCLVQSSGGREGRIECVWDGAASCKIKISLFTFD
jgi:hypothetical protein